MDKTALIALASTRMPFGKYQGYYLMDLPEDYLLWLERNQAFPPGEIGGLMALALLIKTEGLTGLIRPLRPG